MPILKGLAFALLVALAAPALAQDGEAPVDGAVQELESATPADGAAEDTAEDGGTDAAAGDGDDAEPAPPPPPPITIVGLFNLTGDAAALDITAANGALLAAQPRYLAPRPSLLALFLAAGSKL